jgi:hypothetical protein
MLLLLLHCDTAGTQVTQLRPRELLPYLIPRLITRPIPPSHARALGAVAQVAFSCLLLSTLHIENHTVELVIHAAWSYWMPTTSNSAHRIHRTLSETCSNLSALESVSLEVCNCGIALSADIVNTRHEEFSSTLLLVAVTTSDCDVLTRYLSCCQTHCA